jgi:hypothetical protein
VTPIEAAADAAVHGAAPQPAQPGLSRWGRVHSDLTGFGHALLEMAALTGRIALDPQTEEAVELIMQAAGLGAEARELKPVLVLLRDIVAEKTAAQAAAPAFTPAHAAPQEAM